MIDQEDLNHNETIYKLVVELEHFLGSLCYLSGTTNSNWLHICEENLSRLLELADSSLQNCQMNFSSRSHSISRKQSNLHICCLLA